jgi:hypothetical protein
MPTLLLDPRMWGILVFVVLETMAGVTIYHKGVDHGRAEVQAKFDTYRLAAEDSALKEQTKRDAEARAAQITNQEVTAHYESLKTATATAVRALDSARLRAVSALAAAHRSTAPSDPATGLPPDATAEDRVLAECLQRYEEVAGDADVTAVTLKALQDYVNFVVPK